MVKLAMMYPVMCLFDAPGIAWRIRNYFVDGSWITAHAGCSKERPHREVLDL
jgi:hypothetical protein